MVRPSTCSAKMRLGHSGSPQKKRRTRRRITTSRPPTLRPTAARTARAEPARRLDRSRRRRRHLPLPWPPRSPCGSTAACPLPPRPPPPAPPYASTPRPTASTPRSAAARRSASPTEAVVAVRPQRADQARRAARLLLAQWVGSRAASRLGMVSAGMPMKAASGATAKSRALHGDVYEVHRHFGAARGRTGREGREGRRSGPRAGQERRRGDVLRYPVLREREPQWSR